MINELLTVPLDSISRRLVEPRENMSDKHSNMGLNVYPGQGRSGPCFFPLFYELTNQQLGLWMQ